jgi:hypothetical protein
MCTLYRAVTQIEYNDILILGNKFRCIERSLEVKQFAVSETCGHYYGREIVMRLDRVQYILLRVTLSIQAFCNDIIQLDDCDGVSIDKSVLEEFNSAIIQIMPIDENTSRNTAQNN